MTTLSQTGALFKPSSAYLPQELLGKVSLGFFYSFFPPSHWETNTDIGLGVVSSSGWRFSLLGIVYIVILHFTSTPCPLPARGIGRVGSSPLVFRAGGFRRAGSLRPHPRPQLQPAGVRELLPILPAAQVAAARERSVAAGGPRTGTLRSTGDPAQPGGPAILPWGPHTGTPHSPGDPAPPGDSSLRSCTAQGPHTAQETSHGDPTQPRGPASLPQGPCTA